MQDQPVQNPTSNQDPQSYADAYDHPTQSPAPTSDHDAVLPPPVGQNTVSASTTSETLEDQNIFYLLGVEDGTNEQKETFLDELQQVIWEDFLENDVQLLLTKEEHQQLQQMTNNDTKKPLMEQEAVVVFLEKLIPDLEEIMLEKALELKADLVRERVAGLKELHAGKTDTLQKIEEAENLVSQDKWLSAARMLNSLPA
jgi:hypothetical protein